MKFKLNNIKNCRRCNLYRNQLPLLDKKDKCDVMWVGLSAKKVDDIDKNYPLEENTNSGLLIKEIEDVLPSLNYYKTNLVKCLPLDNKGKILILLYHVYYKFSAIFLFHRWLSLHQYLFNLFS